MANTPTTKLGDFLKSGRSAKPIISPSAATQRLEQEKSKRQFGNISSLTLIGREDELTARIEWWDKRGDNIPDQQKRMLEMIRAELNKREREAEDWVEARQQWKERNKYLTFFPEVGPYRRELYPQHVRCMDAGKDYNERLFLAANRTGKTITAALETTYHTTGRYPSWWNGKVFEAPVDCWVANKSAKDVRDINEAELYGPPGDVAARGTGMIPGHLLLSTTPKSGVPNGIEFAQIRHISGGTSRIQSKSFDQGREAFQGVNKHFIWGDEECPDDVYGEMLMRTVTCGGIILLTYTPILGLTPLTTTFLKEAGIEIEGTPMKDRSKEKEKEDASRQS